MGKLLKGGEVIELCADLGGGKTTCVRGIARGFGSKDTVSSPTFTLKKIYKGGEGVEVHHFDFYRLNDAGVVADQLVESLNDPKVITIVEWSDIVQDALPKDRLVIEMQPGRQNAEERIVRVHYPEALAGVVRKLETNWSRSQP